MSERSAERIRKEIASERQELAGDLVVMQAEARKLALKILGGLLALLTLRLAAKLIWKRR